MTTPPQSLSQQAIDATNEEWSKAVDDIRVITGDPMHRDDYVVALYILHSRLVRKLAGNVTQEPWQERACEGDGYRVLSGSEFAERLKRGLVVAA